MNLSLRLATFLALAGSAFSQQQDSSFRLDAEIENDLPKLSWDTEREKTYFMTFSPDLRTWTYVPEVMPGFGGKDFLYVGTNRDQMFYRLHRSNIPTKDIRSTDHDGDGVPSFAELTVSMTDPLKPDTSGNGQSDRMQFPSGTNGIYTDHANGIRYLIADPLPNSNQPGEIIAVPFSDSPGFSIIGDYGEKTYLEEEVGQFGFEEFSSSPPYMPTGKKYARKVEWLDASRYIGNQYISVNPNPTFPNDQNIFFEAGCDKFVGNRDIKYVVATQRSVRTFIIDPDTGSVTATDLGGPFGLGNLAYDRNLFSNPADADLALTHPESPSVEFYSVNWNYSSPEYRETLVFEPPSGYRLGPHFIDTPPFWNRPFDWWDSDEIGSGQYHYADVFLKQRLYDPLPEKTGGTTIADVQADLPSWMISSNADEEMYGLWQLADSGTEGIKRLTYRRFRFRLVPPEDGSNTEPVSADVFFLPTEAEEPEVVMTAEWDGQGQASPYFTVDPLNLRPGVEGIYYLNTTTVSFEPVSNQASDRRSGQEPVVLAPDPTGYDPQQPTLTETVTRHPSRLSFVGVPDEDFLTGRVIVQILGSSSGDIRIIAKDPVSGDQVQVPLGQDVSNLFFSSRGPYHDYDWFLEGAAEGSVEVGAILRRGGGEPSLTVTRTMRVMPPLEILTEENGQTISASQVSVTRSIPVVEIDSVSASQVSVDEGVVSVTISGYLYDDLMDVIPVGKGADISEAFISVDNQEPIRVAVTRQTFGAATTWKPYRSRGRIPPTRVTFPINNSNEIRVTSGSNMLGNAGSDTVVLNWNLTEVPGSVQEPETRELHLEFSGSTSPTRIDRVIIKPTSFSGAAQTLTETEANSLTFTSPQGSLVQLTEQYLPNAQRASLSAVVVAGGYVTSQVNLGAYECLKETGTTTNSFTIRQRRVVDLSNQDFNYALTELVNTETLAEGVTMPFTVGSTDLTNLCVALAGQTPGTQKITLGGRRVPGWGPNRPVIFHMIDGESGRALIYYDDQAGVLRTIAAGQNSVVLNAAIRRESNPVADVDFSTKALTDIVFIDEQGEVMVPPVPTDAATLQDVANGVLDRSELDGLRSAKVRASALKGDNVIEVRSAEIASDVFALVPAGSDAAAGYSRRAFMSEVAPGIYESNQKVVIYSSSPGLAVLNTTVWNRLKAKGFIAIHNSIPSLALKNQGTGGSKEFKYPGRDDHHIFPKFASSRPHDKTRNVDKYTGLLEKIMGADFDVDLYTMPLPKDLHNITKSDTASKIADHTNKWKALFNTLVDDDGNLLDKDVTKSQKAVMDKMYELHDSPRLRKYFKHIRPYPGGSWGPTRQIKSKEEYRTKWRKPGSSTKGLYALDSLLKRLDFRKNDARHKVWKDVSKSLGKVGSAGRKAIPGLGIALSLWVAGEAAASGESAEQILINVVFEGELSEQAVREFLDGNAKLDINIPFVSLTDYDAVTFPNGKSLVVGEMTDIIYTNDAGRVSEKKSAEILKIKTTAAPNEVTITVRNPDRFNESYTSTVDIRRPLACLDKAPIGIFFSIWLAREGFAN